MNKFIKSFLFFIVILTLGGILAIVLYLTYINSNSIKAKDYLVDKYDFKDKDLQATKYVQYVYEDIANCETLWIKKCSKDKDLAFKYEFKTKDDEIIIVLEDTNGILTDDYYKGKEQEDNPKEVVDNSKIEGKENN